MGKINESLLNKIVHSRFEDYLPLIPDASVDVLFTDIPYNIAIDQWDYDFCFKSWLDIVVPKIKDNGLFLIWNTKEIIDKEIIPYFREKGFIAIDSYNWGKTNPRANLDFYRQFEHLFVGYKNKDMDKFIAEEYLSSFQDSEIWASSTEINIYSTESKHKTKKPVKLLERILLDFTDINDIVLDTTSGSGSIPLACWNTHRKFLACEMDEDYYKDSTARLEMAKENMVRSVFLF